jgi:hypothetical protein
MPRVPLVGRFKAQEELKQQIARQNYQRMAARNQARWKDLKEQEELAHEAGLQVDHTGKEWPEVEWEPVDVGIDLAHPDDGIEDKPLPQFGPDVEFSEQVLPGEFGGCV